MVGANLPPGARRYRDAHGRGDRAGPGRRTSAANCPQPTTASALTWMVERACQQNLPGRPQSYDAELAATLTQIVWGALYLEAP